MIMIPETLSGNIRRSRRTLSKGFTQLDNSLLRNRELSFKARGILAHLLSHDDDWVIRMAELCAGVDKSVSVRSGMDELIAAGYARRSRVRGPGGQILGWDYEVFDEPRPEEAAVTETRKPTSGQDSTRSRFSTSGSSTSGKPSPKNTIVKNTIVEEQAQSLRDCAARADGPSDPAGETGISEEELASYTGQAAETPAMLLQSEDDAPDGKDFPWRQIAGAMKRITPMMTMPATGDRRDHAMRKFWRDNGKTVGCFELLAQKVAESDYLMCRNGHKTESGRPYTWSWIFSKNRHGRVRAEEIMEGAFANDKMAFVLTKQAKTHMTKVMMATCAEPVEVNLAELWQGEPRYKSYGKHANGLPDVIDQKS